LLELCTGDFTIRRRRAGRAVYEAGDAFYTPPGHIPVKNEPGTEILWFSPTDELRTNEAVMMKTCRRCRTAQRLSLASASLDGWSRFLNLRGASLGEVARLLAGIVDAEIFVPAHRLDERRELYLKGVSLDTVVRELGLMAVFRPPMV
jgi:hypothetical protein